MLEKFICSLEQMVAAEYAIKEMFTLILLITLMFAGILKFFEWLNKRWGGFDDERIKYQQKVTWKFFHDTVIAFCIAMWILLMLR